ncbi:dihydropteroate synthase [Aurantibacter crassamenti]|uniref:dihydropteroate synthase n=1 Tax=Aurantibacter crassamenti TaxID=1837375 RepID=UPI00193ACA0A|nr:dihydropteroate synthase [Aurantibacter crassamenti]MBM1106281.1 dihydropteroate synthase [Aurantibacter crassamenti]
MTINCKQELINLSSPKVMGILNLTPDSFYDGGKHSDPKSILLHTEKMLTEGATFIDLGAYSSRPGADDISIDEELNRMLPIVALLLKEFPEVILSIDTFRSIVAERCLEIGAALINDISAGMLDAKMMQVVAKYKVPYIMMHMRGTPKTMRELTDYNDISIEIRKYFSERINLARELGINDIIIDPGFGFSKTRPQNFELLQHLNLLKTFDVPILAGLSRKSMIFKTLNINAVSALNGTTALNMLALDKGANILRVHDVKEAIECVHLYEELIGATA